MRIYLTPEKTDNVTVTEFKSYYKAWVKFLIFIWLNITCSLKFTAQLFKEFLTFDSKAAEGLERFKKQLFIYAISPQC